MKKSFSIFVISLFCYTASFAQQDNPPPVVIKQEGATMQTNPDEEPDVRDLPFKKRIRFGLGGLGLNFGTYNSISASPMVGYQVTNQMMLGVEVPYQKSWGTNYYTGYSVDYSLLGYRIFARENIPFLTQLIGNGYARAEYEQYSFLSGGASFNPRPAFLAGLGLGSNRGIQLLLMYDLNFKQGESIYASPVVIRGGVSF